MATAQWAATPITITSIVVATLALFLLFVISLSIYRLYFHPLAAYPGPWLGRLTEWNTVLASLGGESTRTRHAWSQRYGPGPVRIGPNELLFSDLASVRDIYGQSSRPCLKDPAFYRPFTVCGARNVFNSFERAEHARIRRLFAHAFSLAEVRKMQGRVAPILDKFLDVLEAAQQQQQQQEPGGAPQPVDLYEPTSRLFVDIISELSFDESFDTLGGHLVEEAKWADQLQNISALVGMVPFIEWLPVQFVQEAVKARPRMIEFARQRIQAFRARLEKGMVKEGSLLKRVVETEVDMNDEGEYGHGLTQPLTDLELMENAIVFIQAGSETSMSSMLYLLYELDRRPAVREKLVKEIRQACASDTATVPRFETIQNLVSTCVKSISEYWVCRQPFTRHQILTRATSTSSHTSTGSLTRPSASAGPSPSTSHASRPARSSAAITSLPARASATWRIRRTATRPSSQTRRPSCPSGGPSPPKP
ncbi:hypothetical protein SLS64_005462 [Diaporthe eres]